MAGLEYYKIDLHTEYWVLDTRYSKQICPEQSQRLQLTKIQNIVL